MQNIVMYDDWHLLLVTYSEPFDAEDLISAAMSASSIEKVDQNRCVLIDIRDVDVRGLSGADSRRFANFRKAETSGQLVEPAAFLIRSEDDFPYIRMHNQWVDACGLRREADTVITTDLGEALQWLEQKTGQRGLTEAMLQRISL
jgi:hypothetical protein